MRRHLILLGSLGLNVIFVAVWFWTRHHNNKLRVHTPPPVPAVTNSYRTRVVVRKQFFTWQELESPDYKAYVANLREIGCPEQTIRDIIFADVSQLYARKRAAEVPTPDQQWWRYDPDPALIKTADEKVAALEQERQALLATLLGTNWGATDLATPSGIALNGPVLGDLAPEAKRSVLGVVANSEQRTQEYLDAQKAVGKPADPATLAKMGQQLRTELAQLLAPPQLEEFLLRYSQTASALRARLRGVTVTPDEFRSLFRTTDPLEQNFELTAGDALTKANLAASVTNQVDAALKSVLGADRYQAYRTTQDPAYQQALSTADELGDVTPQQITQLYDLNRAALQEKQRINNDTTLQPEQRAAQIAQIEKQQQQASDLLLGQVPDLSPSPAETVPTQIYSYRPGETVDMIGQRYGVSKGAIFSANPTLNFNTLTPGMPIRIPVGPPQ